MVMVDRTLLMFSTIVLNPFEMLKCLGFLRYTTAVTFLSRSQVYERLKTHYATKSKSFYSCADGVPNGAGTT